MDFPVTADFAETANAAQLHDEARGAKQHWPASFVEDEDGSWVYRVDRDDIDAAAVQSALDAHTPVTVAPAPSLQEQIDDLRGRIDKAAAATVTGDAAKVRDALKPTQ